MDQRLVTDLHMLAAGDVIEVRARAGDEPTAWWRVTVLDVVLPSRGSSGGVWTTDFQWVPLSRIG
jgi:hypothetical protein